MGAFLTKRILATIPVMLIVAIIVFTLIRMVPGDPAAVIAGNMATNEDIARIRTELGLDRSFFAQ
ncbi:MAG: ABC transporter permease, partial [Casimicrobium sp.]